MTLSYATIDETRAIVDTFAALSWPAPKSDAVAIGDRLGWTLRLELESGLEYATALSFGRTPASILLDDDHLAQATIHVSSRIDEDDPAQVAELDLAYDDVRSILTGILADAARTRRGSSPKTSWDLSNGGRLAVAHLGFVVAIIVIQERYAAVERAEERRGVSEDEYPGSED